MECQACLCAYLRLFAPYQSYTYVFITYFDVKKFVFLAEKVKKPPEKRKKEV